MKPLLALISWLGLLLMTTGATAQSTNNNENFAYHYGVVTGYEFEESNIPYRRFPMQSLLRGLNDHLDGNGNMSEAEAEKVVQTTRDEIQASKTTSGFDFEQFDFSSMGYAYGVMIGSNWDTYGIKSTPATSKALQRGVKAVFYDRGQVVSREEAQAAVMRHYKLLQGDKQAVQQSENKDFLEQNLTNPTVRMLENGVQYEVLVDVEGAPIGATNKRLQIQYIGKLIDGTVFDDSSEKPIVVTQNSVMPGLSSVLKIMRENQTIKAYIPPSLGYGDQKRGNVPANSVLIYEITLLEVVD